MILNVKSWGRRWRKAGEDWVDRVGGDQGGWGKFCDCLDGVVWCGGHFFGGERQQDGVLVMEVSQLLMVLLLLQIMLMKLVQLLLVQLLLVQLLLVQLLLVQLLLLHLMMLELVMLELRLCKAPSMLLALDGCRPELFLLSPRGLLPLFLREGC